MSWFDWGDKPITSGLSTAVSNPSTSTLIDEVDSTLLHAGLYGGASTNLQRTCQVTWILGASTNAVWRCEQCLSTGLASTAIRDTVFIQTPTAQSGQYVWHMNLTAGDRLRARVNSTFTGVATAAIIVVPLT